MFFAPNPGILAAGVSTSKTYAEFQAHITALATGGSRTWGSVVAQTAGAFTTTAGAVGGLMYGSSWNGFFYRPNAATARVIQHGLPSQAVFDTQVAAGRQIFFRIANDIADQPFFPSVTRNGYASVESSDGTYAAATCTEIIRWDGAKAWKSNPSIGGAESEYTW